MQRILILGGGFWTLDLCFAKDFACVTAGASAAATPSRAQAVAS